MSSQKRTFTHKCTNKIQHTHCGIIEHKQIVKPGRKNQKQKQTKKSPKLGKTEQIINDNQIRIRLSISNTDNKKAV